MFHESELALNAKAKRLFKDASLLCALLVCWVCAGVRRTGEEAAVGGERLRDDVGRHNMQNRAVPTICHGSEPHTDIMSAIAAEKEGEGGGCRLHCTTRHVT